MQTKKSIVKIFSTAFLIIGFSACFNLSKEASTNTTNSSDPEFAKLAAQEYAAQKAQETQNAAQNELQKAAENQLKNASSEINDLEVIWQIPKEKVSGYIIHYGEKVTHLENEISLKEIEIEKFQHPKHGLVYRHYIPNIKKDQKLFVAISAYNSDTVSEQSSAFEVK